MNEKPKDQIVAFVFKHLQGVKRTKPTTFQQIWNHTDYKMQHLMYHEKKDAAN